MDEVKYALCPICHEIMTENHETVPYRNGRAHNSCLYDVEAGKVQDMSAPIGQEIPITLQTLANELSRQRRDIESWGGSHNALATQVQEYERQTREWHQGVYNLLTSLQNSFYEREKDYLNFRADVRATLAEMGVKQQFKDELLGQEPAKWAARGVSSDTLHDVESSMDSQQADLLDMYRRDRDLWKTKYHALWARFKEKGR